MRGALQLRQALAIGDSAAHVPRVDACTRRQCSHGLVASDLILWTTICSILVVACLAAWRRDIEQMACGAR